MVTVNFKKNKIQCIFGNRECKFFFLLFASPKKSQLNEKYKKKKRKKLEKNLKCWLIDIENKIEDDWND